jgi:branched-subunit amino acid transport protein
MTPELVLVIAVLTYGSRALALAFLPPLPPRLARVFDRMPAPLFAGLAAQALVGPGGEVAAPEVLAAAGGAIVLSPLRSVPACLTAGLVAWVIAGWWL